MLSLRKRENASIGVAGLHRAIPSFESTKIMDQLSSNVPLESVHFVPTFKKHSSLNVPLKSVHCVWKVPDFQEQWSLNVPLKSVHFASKVYGFQEQLRSS